MYIYIFCIILQTVQKAVYFKCHDFEPDIV